MDRDLPQEFDEVADRPDPWGDIPDAEAAADPFETPPPKDRVASVDREVDAPEAKKGRSRRRREQTKAAPVDKDPTPQPPPMPAAEPRAEAASTVSTPSGEQDPKKDVTRPEPTEPAPPPPAVDPPSGVASPMADDVSPTDAPPSVPPWPDRALDVLPFADRAAWPGTRDHEDRRGNDEHGPSPTEEPPAPVAEADDPDLDAYTLPPPRASASA